MLLQLQLLPLNGYSSLDIRRTLGRVNSAEQNVHILKGLALCLPNEEEGEDAVCEAEDAEHDEGLPAKVVDGVRCEFRDNEVEEPLGGRGQADSIGSETSPDANVSTGVIQY